MFGTVSLIVASMLTTPASLPGRVSVLPDDEVVVYHIRETPYDPESNVTFTVQLELAAVDSTSEFVCWSVERIVIKQYADSGSMIGEWAETLVDVDSPDGLWWVEHADTSDPQMSEFAVAPPVAGRATALDETEPDLDYSIEGAEYVESASQAASPYTITARLTYLLWKLGAAQPEEEEEEEIVEVTNGYAGPH